MTKKKENLQIYYSEVPNKTGTKMLRTIPFIILTGVKLE